MVLGIKFLPIVMLRYSVLLERESGAEIIFERLLFFYNYSNASRAAEKGEKALRNTCRAC